MAGDRLTWIGHSTVALELGGARLLTDPMLRDRMLHLRRHGTRPDASLLAGLDAVLISHLHLDHLDLPSLRRLGTGVPLVVPRGAGGLLRRRGFTDVTEVTAGDSLDIGGVRVIAVPAEHDRQRLPGGAEADPIGFVVAGPRRVYFAGDTALFDGMADLGDGGIDVALLPIWGWGPSLGPGHMDPEQAARATALLRPAMVVPIHWGTFFPRGLARWRGAALVDPPHAFARAAAGLAPAAEVKLLKPGETLALA